MSLLDKKEMGQRQMMLMKCVWKLGGEGTIKTILEEMKNRYNVVLSVQAANTMFNALIDKGYLERVGKLHQAFIFRATIAEEEFEADELRRSVDLAFDGEESNVVACMLKNGIPEEQLEKIRHLVRKPRTKKD